MFTNTTRRTIAFTALSTLALILSACGSSGMDMSSMSSSTTSAPAGSSAGSANEHNAQDVNFAQMMIVHHQGAIDMAKLAPSRAQSEQVKTLAAKIEAAQAPEIAQMQAWLQEWGESASGPEHSMPGEMSASDMSTLTSASGSAFDKQFLTMMTAHHNGAIDMAKTEQVSGQYQPARDLASAIVTSQTAEVSEMAQLLERV